MVWSGVWNLARRGWARVASLLAATCQHVRRDTRVPGFPPPSTHTYGASAMAASFWTVGNTSATGSPSWFVITEITIPLLGRTVSADE